MKIALTVSQYFYTVYPMLKDYVGAIVVKDINAVPVFQGIDKTFHLNGFINDEFDALVTPEFLNKLIEYNINLLSFDIGPSCKKVSIEKFYKIRGPLLDPRDILAIGTQKIKKIRKYYSGSISLENLDYHKGGAYEYVCEPDFISCAIKEWDVGLTLDIGHVNVSCMHYGISPHDYIKSLPIDRLKEIHISGSKGEEDLHDLPSRGDYDLLKFVLKTKLPEYLVLEYYWDPNLIINEIKKLHKIFMI